jgi:hypothetical protein
MIRLPSRFSAVSHPSVSVVRRFCSTKTPRCHNLVFWAQNQQRTQATHHKVGTARPFKAIHTAIYAKSACLHTHGATDNHHTKCTGLPWSSFGSRRARIVCRGFPICFVPSVWYKRLKLRRLGTKRMGRLSASDLCTPPAEHGSRNTGNGIGALVMSGILLVMTGDGNDWRFLAP